MITCSGLGRGRLGNQMFQYALLRGVAARTGYGVEIPAGPKVTLWSFPLNAGKSAEEALYPHNFRERGFGFCPEVFDQPDGTDYTGYYQTEKYFSHIEAEIRTTFLFPQTIMEEIAPVRTLRQRGPVVSVHVRRRDYVNNDAHADLYGDYYPNAMRMFDACTYLIVSDDIPWCRQRFQGSNMQFFHGSSMYADLAAMAACDHHIISNSTFSWWGAWLNPSPAKQVVRPSVWWGARTAHLEDADICPESWQIADV